MTSSPFLLWSASRVYSSPQLTKEGREQRVVCEGYDYPDDPYILAGSCGLEYTLELTKEGREKRSSSGGGGGWGGGWSTPSNSYSSKSYNDSSHQWSGLGDLILLGVIGIVIYAVYKTCVDSPSMEDRQGGAGS